MPDQKITLLYDNECPVCDAYCRSLEIDPAAGTLDLISARDASETLNEITAMGLDADQGMVLKIEDKIYHGADAMHTLALSSKPSGIFHRLYAWVFSSRLLAKLLYPVLRAGRSLLLKMLGKTKINNLGRAEKL